MDSTFNKVVLTFSGNTQTFREIEIFGTLTPPIYDSVSIQGPDAVFVGGTPPLTATVHGINADQTVKWSSSNTSVATVDSTGVVTGKTAGTATITATSTADTSKFATKTITVPTPTVDRVRIAGDYSIWVGGTSRFSATVFGTNVAQTVKWSSSDTAVATVDPNTGVVTAVAEGTAIIEATSTVDNTKKDSTTISIIPAQTNLVPSAEITTTVTQYVFGDSATNISYLKDGEKDFNISHAVHSRQADGKNYTFAWPSNLYHTGRFVYYNGSLNQERIDASTVAFLRGSDTVYLDTILNAGDTVIIIAPVDSTFNKVVLTFSGSEQNFTEIEIYGTPTPPTVTNVSIAGSDTVLTGGTDTLRATVTGINAPQTVTWSSSNSIVATVSDSGVVQGISGGTVTITATSVADNSQTATKTIVIKAVPINLASSATITTTVTDFYNGDADTNIARLRDGVKDSTADDANTLLIHPSNADSQNFTFAWPGKLYNTGQFIFYNRGETRFHSRIDTSTVAFFHGENRVYIDTILNAGATVTITPDDTIQFDKVVLTFSGGAQNFREIEVYGIVTSPTVTGVTIAGAYGVLVGNTTTLRATVSGTNVLQTVKWSSSNTAVAIVDPITGVVTGVGAGTAEIIATSVVDPTKSATREIIVPSPTVTGVSIQSFWRYIAGSYSIWVGGTAQFSATVTGSNISQTVKWSSSDPTVATVDSVTGVVRGVAEGTVPLRRLLHRTIPKPLAKPLL